MIIGVGDLEWFDFNLYWWRSMMVSVNSESK